MSDLTSILVIFLSNASFSAECGTAWENLCKCHTFTGKHTVFLHVEKILHYMLISQKNKSPNNGYSYHLISVYL